MDNSKKPAFLNKAQNFHLSTKNNQSLIEENQKLSDTLNELIASANQNQSTQEKFYALEIYFLESPSYESLLNRILNELQQKLHLAQVELILVDTEHEIQQLIHEIYNHLNYSNLIYVENIDSIKPLYADTIQLNLNQQLSTIKKLFNGQPQLSKSVAQIPLKRGNQVIGSLHLGSKNLKRFHDGLATNFLQHLGSIISVCIESSLNQERYIHLSLVDMLTRTKNRRYFFQALAKEIARASRSSFPISCLFIDIDHFKKINDNLGHLVGDKVLRAVAQSINPLLRPSDILARFGGEEFTILLPGCNSNQAIEIAERIRSKIENMQIKDVGTETPCRLTVSLGVSTWKPEQQKGNVETIQNYLINAADQAVYQAKAAGRNCVRVANH